MTSIQIEEQTVCEPVDQTEQSDTSKIHKANKTAYINVRKRLRKVNRKVTISKVLRIPLTQMTFKRPARTRRRRKHVLVFDVRHLWT